jgi:hypothetical protein
MPARQTAKTGAGGKRKRQTDESTQAATQAAPPGQAGVFPDVFVVNWEVSACVKEFAGADDEIMYEDYKDPDFVGTQV